MNIAQLRTLIAIADNRSFNMAARRLFVTPSAVSHQMRELETELRVALFDRSTRPPQLNPHGRAVVAQGREALLRFDALIETAKSPGEIGGKLKLGCINGVSSELIPVALANIRATHPSVQVRIDEGISGPLADRVIRRELDAAIINKPLEPDPKLQYLHITEEALVVVAPSGSKATRWQELIQMHPFIRFNHTTSMGALIERTLRDADLDLEEAMELDSSEVIVSMAKAGLGVGVVPAGRLNFVPANSVFVLPFGTPPIQRQVVLVERRNSTRSDLSQIVVTELKRLSAQTA